MLGTEPKDEMYLFRERYNKPPDSLLQQRGEKWAVRKQTLCLSLPKMLLISCKNKPPWRKLLFTLPQSPAGIPAGTVSLCSAPRGQTQISPSMPQSTATSTHIHFHGTMEDENCLGSNINTGRERAEGEVSWSRHPVSQG